MQPGDILYIHWDKSRYDPNAEYPFGHTEMWAGNNQTLSHGGPNWNDMGPQFKNFDYRKDHILMARRYKGFIDNSYSGSSRRRGYARSMMSGVKAGISDNAKRVISEYGISTSGQSPRYASLGYAEGAEYNQFLAVIIDLLAAIADNTKGLTDLQKSLSKRGIDMEYSTLEKAAANARRRSARARANSVGGYKPTFTPASTFDSASAQDLMNSPTGFMVQAMEALAIE